MNGKGRLLVLALAVLAAWSVWWLRQLETTTPSDRGAPPHRIDYTMEKFELTVMDPTGKPEYRLHADAMTHYADDDSAEFQRLNIDYIAADKSRWRLGAEQGWMASHLAEIRLHGAVHVEGLGPRPIMIATRDVRIDPAQRTAVTEAPVTLTGPWVRVTATGMRVFFNQERVQFLSKVQGYYAAHAQ